MSYKNILNKRKKRMKDNIHFFIPDDEFDKFNFSMKYTKLNENVPKIQKETIKLFNYLKEKFTDLIEDYDYGFGDENDLHILIKFTDENIKITEFMDLIRNSEWDKFKEILVKYMENK